MSIIRCKKCGAELNFIEGASTVECDYCGRVQTLNESSQTGNGMCSSVQQTPTTQPTVRIQQTVASQLVSTTSVPRIPSNNRYAGYDQVVARIAKDLIDKLFVNIKARQWIPVSQKSLATSYEFEVCVQSDRIYLFGPRLGPCEVFFVNYGRRSVPDTVAFIYAIEPAMKQYLKEAAMAKFAYIHPLSKYSVTGGSFTYNGRVYMEFKIEQYLYPDNNLKSW